MDVSASTQASGKILYQQQHKTEPLSEISSRQINEITTTSPQQNFYISQIVKNMSLC